MPCGKQEYVIIDHTLDGVWQVASYKLEAYHINLSLSHVVFSSASSSSPHPSSSLSSSSSFSSCFNAIWAAAVSSRRFGSWFPYFEKLHREGPHTHVQALQWEQEASSSGGSGLVCPSRAFPAHLQEKIRIFGHRQLSTHAAILGHSNENRRISLLVCKSPWIGAVGHLDLAISTHPAVWCDCPVLPSCCLECEFWILLLRPQSSERAERGLASQGAKERQPVHLNENIASIIEQITIPFLEEKSSGGFILPNMASIAFCPWWWENKWAAVTY